MKGRSERTRTHIYKKDKTTDDGYEYIYLVRNYQEENVTNKESGRNHI